MNRQFLQKKGKMVLFFLLIFSTFSTFAQVTTSSIRGKVIDDTGEDVIGATILATHQPSGTSYGVVTEVDGTFFIPNMRIGGPYSVEASYVGFQDYKVEGLQLQLGERKTVDITLNSGVELEEIIVSGEKGALINPDKTGAGSVVSLEQLQTLPTITRSTADLTRLNPMSAEGGSFGGRNDQFNNYTLDGSVFNNPFGLDAATPGGQAGAQPISLDAIEQVSVSLAPYDVTKAGFTGASIDAVTKSGTNEIKGSVFSYFRNSDMTGGKVAGTEVNRGDLSQLQLGASLGGAFVKNKIFFFANFEMERRSDLGSYFEPNRGTNGANISRVLASDMESISTLLRNEYGYETGDISGFKHNTDNEKGLFKLNFNISNAHKLAVTYNFLRASRDLPAHPSAIGSRGPDLQTLQFENAGYAINNNIQAVKAELNSLFGSKYSNKFQASYTQFRDKRTPKSSPFPVVNIGKEGVRYIIAGHEPFSINNVLDQDVIQLTNNFNYYTKNHTFTAGVSFERFAFNNSFNLTGYGARVFFPDIDINDAAAVLTSDGFRAEVNAADSTFTANNANNNWALAELNIGQLAFYIQDEISISDKLRLTLGLRIDKPLYFDTETKMQESIDRNCCYSPDNDYFDKDGNSIKLNSLELPSSKPLISPRLGFNADLSEKSQLRGGSGLFTGRLPFVWIGNQIANPNSFFYVTTDPDFKFPQVWRSNLGYDQSFGEGWEFSADFIYTQDIQGAMVRNFGNATPSGTLDGPGSRPIYLAADKGSNNAYVFTNVNEGRSTNLSFTLKKQFTNGINASLAYNFLDSQDAASIDAEISSDAFERNPANIQNTNTPELSQSLYGNQHRFVGSFYKMFKFNEKSGLHLAIFAEAVKGGRYSFTYSGDINNDGSTLNDLIYIPTNTELNEMNFTSDAERTAFNSFIEQDEYLSENRGSFAEKFASINPWYTKIDARLMYEVGVLENDNIQISLDILNLGNLINSNWGVRQNATNTGLVQPLGVTVADGTPTYTFNTDRTNTYQNDFSLSSRWQMQLGLRYNF